jgi:YesN/AraC family two-component response regulator
MEQGKEIKIMALILIIDDEPQIRSMLKLMLERDGHEVAEAPDGIEGIRIYRQNPADLIITDLIMPNKDGIGMIIELKKEFPDVKIIAMSGGGLNKPDGYLKGAEKLGAACTLTKPIDRDEMLRAIKDVIKSPSSQIDQRQSE